MMKLVVYVHGLSQAAYLLLTDVSAAALNQISCSLLISSQIRNWFIFSEKQKETT